MVSLITLTAFVPAALALNVTPGADMMFCLGQGLRSGPGAAWAASAGIAVGAMVHGAIAGAGVGALIASLPGSFEIIRWIGVAYLLWLAVQTITSRTSPAAAPKSAARHAFRAGLMVNLSNPKVILFVLAFVPQFVNPQAGSVLGQFLIFGAVLALGGFVVNGMVGVFAGRLSARLVGAAGPLGWITGGIYTTLALRLALMERG